MNKYINTLKRLPFPMAGAFSPHARRNDSGPSQRSTLAITAVSTEIPCPCLCPSHARDLPYPGCYDSLSGMWRPRLIPSAAKISSPLTFSKKTYFHFVVIQKQAAQAIGQPDSMRSDQMHHTASHKGFSLDVSGSVTYDMSRPASQKHALGAEGEAAPEPKRVAIGSDNDDGSLARAGSLALSGMTEVMRVLAGEGACADTPGGGGT